MNTAAAVTAAQEATPARSRETDVPDHWRSTTLGDVAVVVRDRVDPKAVAPQRYLGLEHLASGRRLISDWGSTDDVKSAATPFIAGDTLFGRLRPYLQKGCLAPFDGVCTTEILVLRPLGSVDSRFLALLVCNDRVFHECVHLSTGTRMPRVSAKNLMGISVMVPPVEEQRRIAEVVEEHLSRLDAAEARVVATRTRLEQLDRSILQAALAVPRGQNEELPEGWEQTTIGQVADVVAGGTPRTKVPEFWSGDIVWVTPTEIVANKGGVIVDSKRKITQQGLDGSSAKMLPVDAVLLTSRATIGTVALAGVPLATNQGFASLVCGERLVPKFAMYWCQANTHELVSRAGGTTFREISRKKVAAIPLKLPPLLEQRRIVEVLEERLSRLDRLKQAVDTVIVHVASLRRAILAAALNGRLTSEYLAA